ncbi:hypothetical protein mvi_36680 [Methylobacterium indicum]|uniref:Uncharacterized protein n=1 Tax=Methylobacterium indicum TaxID=1775910 RepID=A0A8H8WVW4_9HYPH|nr:hypothetical protein mvi_36680 [Methylobacterium indicum]
MQGGLRVEQVRPRAGALGKDRIGPGEALVEAHEFVGGDIQRRGEASPGRREPDRVEIVNHCGGTIRILNPNGTGSWLGLGLGPPAIAIGVGGAARTGSPQFRCRGGVLTGPIRRP